MKSFYPFFLKIPDFFGKIKSERGETIRMILIIFNQNGKTVGKPFYNEGAKDIRRMQGVKQVFPKAGKSELSFLTALFCGTVRILYPRVDREDLWEDLWNQ